MMVAEEESLKERLLKSIALCRKELDILCRELQLDPFEVSYCFSLLAFCWQQSSAAWPLPGCLGEAGPRKASACSKPLFLTLGRAEGSVAPRRSGAGRWL